MDHSNNQGFNASNNYQQTSYGDVNIGTIQADFRIEDFPKTENIQGYNSTVIAEEYDVFENSEANPNNDTSVQETILDSSGSVSNINEKHDNKVETSNLDTQTESSMTTEPIPEPDNDLSSEPSSQTGTTPTQSNGSHPSGNESTTPPSSMTGTGMAAGGMMAGGLSSGGMSSGGMSENSMSGNKSLGSGSMSSLGKQGKKEDDEKKQDKSIMDLFGQTDEAEDTMQEDTNLTDPNGEITETGTTYMQENEEAETLYDMEPEEEKE